MVTRLKREAVPLFVDDRIGSKDLCEPLADLGLTTELLRLPFGDVAFEGRGPKDQSLNIGVELKKLQDLVSSIRTGRLSGHQLPGMVGPDGAYDQGFLVVEGQWRTDPSGHVVTYHGKRLGWQPLSGNMHTSELHKKLLTFELCGGLHVRLTNSREDTLRFLVDLYRWWRDKPMDAHSSHLAVHKPFGFLPISDFRQTVSRFPGVGLKASLAVEQHFHSSLRRAVSAGVAEWAAIETKDQQGRSRRLGLKVAERIVQFCKGEGV